MPDGPRFMLDRFNPEDGVIRLLPNANYCLPFVTAQHPIRPKFSKKDSLATVEACILKFEGMRVTLRKKIRAVYKKEPQNSSKIHACGEF